MIDYIENLILNYKIPETPIKLDIVIEGGALNGYYALGCLKLIKGLEKKGYFKVERFSGASVGSLLGSLYLLNKLEIFTDLYEELKKNYVLDTSVYLTEANSIFKFGRNDIFIPFIKKITKQNY